VLPIVDTHVHFWNHKHPELRWDWLAADAVHPILGDIDGIKSEVFDARHLWAEARFADVTHFVHVQAAIGSPDPVTETVWLTEMAGRHGIPHGIVGHADLGSDDAERQLARHLESPLFRGVRDFAAEPTLAAGDLPATYDRSLRFLAAHDLVFDLDCEYPNMAAAGALAARHPDLRIVLEHFGYPRRRDDDYFQAWRAALTDLAKYPNVVCKISGLAMTDPLFSRESLRPWAEHCLDSFGPQRCVVGSNWPVDRLFSSYDSIMDCYRDYVSTLSADEQRAVLSGNALDIYRLAS
jgi:predicted TIM-barrel fold metal-dependent hydrolase